MQQIAVLKPLHVSPIYTHTYTHVYTHIHTHPLRFIHYSAWPPLYPSLHPSHPNTPPPAYSLMGCYGPASTILVSRIR